MNSLSNFALLVKHLTVIRTRIMVFLRNLVKTHNRGWKAAHDLGVESSTRTTFDRGVAATFLAQYGRRPRYALDAFSLVFDMYGKRGVSALFTVMYRGESLGSDTTWMMLARKFGSVVAAYDMPEGMFASSGSGMGI